MARSVRFCRRTAATARKCWQGTAGAGIDIDALAARLQDEAREVRLSSSWSELMDVIAAKSAALKSAKAS